MESAAKSHSWRIVVNMRLCMGPIGSAAFHGGELGVLCTNTPLPDQIQKRNASCDFEFRNCTGEAVDYEKARKIEGHLCVALISRLVSKNLARA
jgi:hypothetical protein